MNSSIREILERHPRWSTVNAVVAQLHRAGHQTVLAGGCVRDALLGVSPSDFDVATSATPEQVAGAFPKTLAVGKEFGVMVVITDEGPIEVATFRSDGPYVDGRHPSSVTFGDLKADASRRDFTVNALFYDIQSDQVIDLVEGERDLRAKVIRTVGEPAARFQEDHLRMLRAVRFSAQLDFHIEPKTWQMLVEMAALVKSVSAERVLQELRKTLRSPRPDAGFWALVQSRLWQQIFSEWPKLYVDEPSAVKTCLRLRALGGARPFAVLLAECLWPVAEEKTRLEAALRRLTLAKAEQHLLFHLQAALKEFLSQPPVARSRRIELLASEGGEHLPDMVWLHGEQSQMAALSEALLGYRQVALEDGSLPPPLIDGHDLAKLGIAPGVRMGELLREVRLRQLDGELTSKSAALAYVRQWLRPDPAN